MSEAVTDSDLQLLARYTRDRAEDAFAEIVRRHLDLVHSAALRQVRSPQLAEEVAQSVFTDLARDASKLKPDTILTAWLYQVTRHTAIDVVRREARRQMREQIATEMNAMSAMTADWTHIEPLLDEAMHALDDTDRAAVLLRYFENKSLREVGATLGTSDDAAQKRVSRAVEHLREFFAKRGVAIGGSGLTVLISANAVQSAPLVLAATISTAAVLTGTTIHTSTAIAAIKALAMTTMQKALITGVVVVLMGAGTYVARQASQLHEQVRILHGAQARLKERQVEANEQLLLLQQQKSSLSNTLESLQEENEKLKRDAVELLTLRAEVGALRRATNELANMHRLEIPPAPLSKSEWDIELLARHKNVLAGGWMQAFVDYANSHQGLFPASFDEAKPFFPAATETWGNAGSEDFEILYHGSLNAITDREVILFREKKLWQNSAGQRGRMEVIATGPWYGLGSTSAVRYEVVPPSFTDADFTDFEKARIIPEPGQSIDVK